MAVLNTIYNLVQCGSGSALGTGTKGCDQYLMKTSSIWLLERGFALDGTEELDQTYVQQLQAQGKLIILKGIVEFTDNSSEDTIETLPDGTQSVTTEGKYMFGASFVNGLAYHAALKSLSSFNAYDAMFVDSKGNILGTKSSDGSLKGFSVGMLQGAKLTFATDSTRQREGIALQLTERVELDTNYIYLSQKEIGDYYPQLEDGVNEIELSITTPTNLDTTIVVKAKSKNNGQVFTGLLSADFLLTNDGSTLSQTVAESPSGTYTFTVAALGTNEVITARVYDTAGSTIGVVKDGAVYKSAIVDTIVIA